MGLTKIERLYAIKASTREMHLRRPVTSQGASFGMWGSRVAVKQKGSNPELGEQLMISRFLTFLATWGCEKVYRFLDQRENRGMPPQ